MVSKPLLWLVGFTLLHIVTGLVADDRVAEPAEKKSAPLYDSRPGHPWDQAREIFYIRRFSTGEVFEHPHAFAPPWDEYVPFVHDEAFYEQVRSRLDAVEKLPPAQMEQQSALRRLIFLRDLWPAFDG